MDLSISSTSAILYSNTINALLELSKANIERVDMWFSWMLGIAGALGSFMTIVFAAIAYLTWKHYGQAQKAEQLLTELEKRRLQFDESGQYIADTALKQAAMRQRAARQRTSLLRSEVAELAHKHRGFAPILFQAIGEDAIYAIDELGYKHWIPNPTTLRRMGYSGPDIKRISKEEIDKIPTGEHIPDLLNI